MNNEGFDLPIEEDAAPGKERRNTVRQPKKAELLAQIADIEEKKKPVRRKACYEAKFDQGVARFKVIPVQIFIIEDKDANAIGMTLKKGINNVLTIEKEQISLIQVFQTTKTLAL